MHHTFFLSVAIVGLLSGGANAIMASRRHARFGAKDVALWVQRIVSYGSLGMGLLWFVELGTDWQLFVNFNLPFWLWVFVSLAAGLLLESLIERATWLFYRKRFGIPS